MIRREFITLLGGAAAWPLAARAQQPANMLRVALVALVVLLAAPLVGEAQQAQKLPRLCFLTFDPDTSRSTRFGAFFQGLRELGYVDRQTITIDYLSADGRGERFPALAAECLRLKADIIAVSTTPAAQVAKNTTHTIPIVMIALGDPVGTGLVDSLAQPGGNVTGMSQMVSELAAKRLELLKEAVPGISRALVLSYLADPIAPLQVKSLQQAARSLGVTLQIRNIGTADDLPAAFDAGAKERAEGLLTTAESIFVVHRARMGELAARHRLPAMYPYSIIVEDGGLMAYDINIPDLHRRAATYVDRILKGAKPSDLAVQQPTKFELVINLKAAKAIGLTISEAFLLRADKLIE
jgi:putative ABC transport system substrate-binding protein